MQNNLFDFFFFFPTKKKVLVSSIRMSLISRLIKATKLEEKKEKLKQAPWKRAVCAHLPSPPCLASASPATRRSLPRAGKARCREQPPTARRASGAPVRLCQILRLAPSLLDAFISKKGLLCYSYIFTVVHGARVNSTLPLKFPSVGKHGLWG